MKNSVLSTNCEGMLPLCSARAHKYVKTDFAAFRPTYSQVMVEIAGQENFSIAQQLDAASCTAILGVFGEMPQAVLRAAPGPIGRQCEEPAPHHRGRLGSLG